MKKFVSVVLSSIIALSHVITMFSVSASSPDDISYITEEYTPIIFSPETELDIELGATMNRFYGSGGQVDTTTFFYNQLTANQKELYNQIWAAGPVSKIMIDISKLDTPTLSSTSELFRIVDQDVMMAITALCEDKPMFFWQDEYITSLGYQVPSNYNNYTTKLKSLEIEIKLDLNDFADYNDVIEKQAELVEKIGSIPVHGFSRYEKIKSINDYLANNIEYSEPANAHNPYGALVNGLCVCEGYAEAFKILCDREGIPCLNVIGTGNGGAHKWNMVQMEDNKWYLIDVTWNDSSRIYYSYFLIGSDTKAPFYSNNSQVADSTVHIPTGKYFSTVKTALIYPVLSTGAYSVALMAPDAPDIAFDNARGVIMVGKDVTEYHRKFADPDIYVLDTDFNTTRNGSGTTTSTLTVTDGTTTKEYLVAMRGDVDASNDVSATDYTVMTQVCATTYKVDDGTAKFYAGDMNQDGAVDGFDAIALELYTNGELLYN